MNRTNEAAKHQLYSELSTTANAIDKDKSPYFNPFAYMARSHAAFIAYTESAKIPCAGSQALNAVPFYIFDKARNELLCELTAVLEQLRTDVKGDNISGYRDFFIAAFDRFDNAVGVNSQNLSANKPSVLNAVIAETHRKETLTLSDFFTTRYELNPITGKHELVTTFTGLK